MNLLICLNKISSLLDLALIFRFLFISILIIDDIDIAQSSKIHDFFTARTFYLYLTSILILSSYFINFSLKILRFSD